MGRTVPAVMAFALAASVAVPAGAASYRFEWVGAGGYRFEGAISIPDDLAQAAHVDEKAVRCFRIVGFRDDEQVGRFGLGALTPQSYWSVNFEPKALRFRTGGSSYGPNGQEWNMNGSGVGCGAGGFGFNAGDATQDLCIDDRLIFASQIARDTPLSVTRADEIRFTAEDCIADPMVS